MTYEFDLKEGNHKLKKWLDYSKKEFLESFMMAFKWPDMKKKRRSAHYISQWKNLETTIMSQADLAHEYKSGQKKLVPIVFSHGLTASRTVYQVCAQELA